jgi:protein SCO1/2
MKLKIQEQQGNPQIQNLKNNKGMGKKLILGLAISLFLLQACNVNKKTENTIKDKAISDLSIYNLPSKWSNQDGLAIEMKDLKGEVLVMVMIYTSCKAACPRLVADMRNIESRLSDNIKKNVKLVLVSIDPTVDTPERLKSFSIENKMEGDQWVFLRSTEENTREFAAVLAVNYKKIAPLDFSHSNIISVFNADGELAFQQEGLGVNSDETIKKITEEAEKLN